MTDITREIDALIALQKERSEFVRRRAHNRFKGVLHQRELELAEKCERTAAALEAAKGLYATMGYYGRAAYIGGPHWNKQRVPDGERARDAIAAFEAVFRKGAEGC